jgi:hypothetical protein
LSSKTKICIKQFYKDSECIFVFLWLVSCLKAFKMRRQNKDRKIINILWGKDKGHIVNSKY